MPENGVFHNLILAKIDVKYPAHAQQVMHAFWGVGQMSFVKHAIFVDKDAPKLSDDIAITKWILNRVKIENILITKGIVDALDHSSNQFAVGGKLGVDCTNDEVEKLDIKILEDKKLLKKMQQISKTIISLKQYHKDTKNPITIIKVKKKKSQKLVFAKLKPLFKYIKIVVFVDDKNNDLDNAYMLLWRVVNNIDSNRDIFIDKNTIGIDGTNKNKLDNFHRRWPSDVVCSKSVINNLREKELINCDDDFIKKWGIL
jgi:4-hydroxy-3-polyprenylbenzoate decarboxylase